MAIINTSLLFLLVILSFSSLSLHHHFFAIIIIVISILFSCLSTLFVQLMLQAALSASLTQATPNNKNRENDEGERKNNVGKSQNNEDKEVAKIIVEKEDKLEEMTENEIKAEIERSILLSRIKVLETAQKNQKVLKIQNAGNVKNYSQQVIDSDNSDTENEEEEGEDRGEEEEEEEEEEEGEEEGEDENGESDDEDKERDIKNKVEKSDRNKDYEREEEGEDEEEDKVDRVREQLRLTRQLWKQSSKQTHLGANSEAGAIGIPTKFKSVKNISGIDKKKKINGNEKSKKIGRKGRENEVESSRREEEKGSDGGREREGEARRARRDVLKDAGDSSRVGVGLGKVSGLQDLYSAQLDRLMSMAEEVISRK